MSVVSLRVAFVRISEDYQDGDYSSIVILGYLFCRNFAHELLCTKHNYSVFPKETAGVRALRHDVFVCIGAMFHFRRSVTTYAIVIIDCARRSSVSR